VDARKEAVAVSVDGSTTTFAGTVKKSGGVSEIINKDVARVIDATGSIVKVTTTIEFKTSSKEDFYFLAFPTAQAEKLAYIKVGTKKDKTILSTGKPTSR
jgi:Ribophorin I